MAQIAAEENHSLCADERRAVVVGLGQRVPVGQASSASVAASQLVDAKHFAGEHVCELAAGNKFSIVLTSKTPRAKQGQGQVEQEQDKAAMPRLGYARDATWA